MERGLTKQRVIAELTRSPHGKLMDYLPIASQAAKEDGEFFAHLIAWNERNGQIRDAKVALPLCAMVPGYAFAENSFAHLALLDPRNLVRAFRFADDVRKSATIPMRQLRATIKRYLQVRESNVARFDRTALTHRRSLVELYALMHLKPDPRAKSILFEDAKPLGSVFSIVANLPNLTPEAAAVDILKHRLPFLVVTSALGANAKHPDLVMAMIERMTPTELVSNTKMLERMGLKENPVLRGAYEAALGRVAASKKANVLKTTRAAEQVTDEKLKAKLQATQERQLIATVEGDWLVLGDKSSSMQESVEAAKLVAATLARMTKGKVLLVFFNENPQAIDVTGLTYDQIKAKTEHTRAGGSTSIGCGVRYALEQKFEPSGIAIVSDGAENTAPAFATAYQQLSKKIDNEPAIYLYWTKCTQPNPYNNDPEALKRNCDRAGIEMQVFDIRGGVDYYSLPNLVTTMRASRYSLVDEIMEVPLLTRDEVFADGVQEEEAEFRVLPVTGESVQVVRT